jgi:hypothetical protein
MTVVIKHFKGGSLSGTRICDSTGRADSWGCNTIDSNPFKACSWFGSSGPAYITQGCYDSLSEGNKAQCPRLYHGIVSNSGYYKVYSTAYYNHYKLDPTSIVKCWSKACFVLCPDITSCEGVVYDPICVGTNRYATVCVQGARVKGALIEADSTECGYVPPKPECTPGDKKPGEICNTDGMWVPHTPEEPEEPEPEEGRLYVKFDFPYLDLLPGVPYEPWMWIPPGFKIVEE